MIFLICLSAFIVSDDLFSVFHLGGFTVRLFQLALLPVLAKGIWGWLARSVWPVGFGSLLLWTLFIVSFVPNGSLLSRSFFYGLWLVFCVLMVLGIVAAIDTHEKLMTVLRWYVYSYAFSAVFGLSQLLLPLAGVQPLLVRQWWFPERLARINGFTYEPSYYATYMITGWVMMDYLRWKKSGIPGLRVCYWLVTVALLLCSSRMGWTLMLAWLGIRVFWHIRENTVPWRKIATVSAVLLIAGAGLARSTDLSTLTFLASGLGVSDDTSADSTLGRWQIAMQTLHIYTSTPIIGVSLGGVAPAIGRQNSATIVDNEDAKDNEGLCTTLEVLAASGTFGFLFYLAYVAGLFRAMAQLPQEEVLGKALGWGLVFLILILQLNQNILRSYLWFHIGLLSAAYRLVPHAAYAVQPVVQHA